ncbi:MAG: ACT domain-containing protein [Nitriliruptorales bacterium]|nr:ACT domain-containing protein [Nitriliruptorales bacterium]
MELDVIAGTWAVCRLAADAPLPRWVELDAGFVSVTRTATELSIVTADEAVPDGVAAERGWRALAVRGPLDFSLTGVLASLAAPLADAGIPIFAISTYDTDWLLVPGARLDAAVPVLESAGHTVHGQPPT